MSSKLLSVVMPIYNVERFLPDSIESVISKKYYDDIEILLIDDGSTDGSKTVCKSYSIKYNNISYFYKENGGLSDARNFGLRKATAEYVFFFDSDDMLLDHAIDEIYETLNNNKPQVLIWDAMIIDEENRILDNSAETYYLHNGLCSNQKYSGLDFIKYQINDHNDYVTTVWLGAYNRELLISNNLFFEKGLLHEDELWTQKVLLNTENLIYVDKKWYLYRIRSNSIMNSTSKNKERNLSSLIYSYNSLYSYINWKIDDTDKKTMLLANITKRYLNSLVHYDVTNYKKLYNQINRQVILKNSFSIVNVVQSLLLCIDISLFVKIAKIGKRLKGNKR